MHIVGWSYKFKKVEIICIISICAMKWSDGVVSIYNEQLRYVRLHFETKNSTQTHQTYWICLRYAKNWPTMYAWLTTMLYKLTYLKTKIVGAFAFQMQACVARSTTTTMFYCSNYYKLFFVYCLSSVVICMWCFFSISSLPSWRINTYISTNL